MINYVVDTTLSSIAINIQDWYDNNRKTIETNDLLKNREKITKTEEINLKKIFYDKTELLSYNALFNWVLGARGTGKTYGFKKWCFESEGQAVWIRRYQEDIDDLVGKFTTDIAQTGMFDDHEITIEKDMIKIDGEVKVFLIALSTSRRKKSQSYHYVNKIIFDEALEESRNRYLKDEVNLFLGLYETINRLRIDGRRDCRVIFLANNVSFVNPYFAYFKVTPFTQRFKKFAGGELVVENYQNDAFIELKKASRFGKLIDGTNYGRYMIDNEVWLDDSAFIVKRPSDTSLVCNVHYEGAYFGVWVHRDRTRVYCCEDYNLKGKMTYAPKYSVGEGEIPLRNNKEIMQLWNLSYENGSLFFTNNSIKQWVFNMMLGDWK